jgi:protein-S-isoprenylcysteine O-methyltransferase Ste14
MGAVTLAYSGIVYLIFFATFLYLIAFVGGDMIPFITVPKTLDRGPSGLAEAPAALVNLGLLVLFGLQHSLMARPGFKKLFTRVVPHAAERSTYVLATVIVLWLLFYFWRPMPETVWSVDSALWAGVLTGLFFVGFGLVLATTFMINHFDLFGLLQGWTRFRRVEMAKPEFRTPYLYAHIRHPLYLGFLIAFWATPHMTVGHLLFAAVWTAYIFIAIGYEERDLVLVFGEKYRSYIASTPSILPFGRRRESRDPPSS